MDFCPRIHGGRLPSGITEGVWGVRGLVGGVGEAEVDGQVVAD